MRSPKEVWDLWESLKLNPTSSHMVSDAVSFILAHQTRYEVAGKDYGIPFWVIGAIHYREASFNFNTWLANDDPLFSHHSGKALKTVHVPAGLGPATSWENATTQSLRHEGWNSPALRWDLASSLIHEEAYNGWGYQKHGIQSPYVWAGTNHYVSGMYVADGEWSQSAVDHRIGCASIAYGLKQHGVDLNEQPYV